VSDEQPDPAQRNSRQDVSQGAKALAVAWSLPFQLVIPPLVGGGIGYLLDHWLHTKPALMLVLGLLGFIVGLREVIKTAGLLDKKDGG
jgi:ATP synthase protein I